MIGRVHVIGERKHRAREAAGLLLHGRQGLPGDRADIAAEFGRSAGCGLPLSRRTPIGTNRSSTITAAGGGGDRETRRQRERDALVI